MKVLLPQERILSLPGVTPLSYDDEALFRFVFPKNAVHYSRSWLYALRASHLEDGELGFKYVHHEAVAVVGIRNGYVYVTPVADTTGGARLSQFCTLLNEATPDPVVVKKIDRELYPILATHCAPPGENTGLALEDDSVPEMLLRLQRLFPGPTGDLSPAAENLGRQARKYGQRAGGITIVDSPEKLSPVLAEVFLAQHKEKFENYLPVIRYLRGGASANYKTRLYLQGGEVRGLYIAELLALGEAGLYCAVTAKDEPGITEWMDLGFFRHLHTEGVQTLHLGGAESAGISRFIDKLLPHRPSYLVEAALFTARGADNTGIRIRLAREEDISALAAVYRDFYNSISDLGERWSSGAAHKFVAYLYRRQPDLFFVAECDGELAGGAAAAIQPWWDGNHLVEGELFVKPGSPGANLAKALLKTLLAQAQQRHQAVAWDTIAPITGKHPFSAYAELGFGKVDHWVALSGDTQVLLARLSG